tara:strand:- start:15 stop:521 length:507 start_codon:yes stop_codon:yes gene_type:complete
MPRFYERYNKGLAPYPIPAWLWFGLMLFCVAAALPTYGISLVLLIAIAWDRQSRQDITPHPAAKINEDLIQEDLRKGREKKRLDKNYVEQKVERSMYDRDWNPLGLPKNEWMALSSDERVAAYKKHFGQDQDEQEEQESHQSYVHYGPRGGRYTEETTRDGRRYRRYF